MQWAQMLTEARCGQRGVWVAPNRDGFDQRARATVEQFPDEFELESAGDMLRHRESRGYVLLQTVR